MTKPKEKARLCDTCIEDPGCQYTIGPDMNCADYSPTFTARVVDELAEARKNHGAYQNTHHGYAILLEEVDEFWDWVKLRRKDRLADHGLSELVQIAAVAQRIAEDCGLVHEKTDDPKQYGFLFKAEMILAILDRRKTQTRRVCTPHNSLIDGTGEGIRAHWQHLQWDKAWADPGPSPAGNPGPYWKVPCHCLGDADDLRVVHRVYPRVQVGDAIWARETWRFLGTDMLKFGRTHSRQIGVFDYKAGPDNPYKRRIERPCQDIEKYMATIHGKRWRSPLHLPRWAARIRLPVTGVKAERVREITAGDAEAEGVERLCAEGTMGRAAHALRAFSTLWDSINGQKPGCAWKDNPPTWCYGWEPLEAK